MILLSWVLVEKIVATSEAVLALGDVIGYNERLVLQAASQCKNFINALSRSVIPYDKVSRCVVYIEGVLKKIDGKKYTKDQDGPLFIYKQEIQHQLKCYLEKIIKNLKEYQAEQSRADFKRVREMARKQEEEKKKKIITEE